MQTAILLKNLKNKLYLVYTLNVLDWILTILLLKTGYFYEANPIARTFINNAQLGLIIKCLIPFIMVFIVNHFMHILDFSELKKADMIVSFGLTVYLAITLDHVINFLLLLIR